MKNTTSPIKVKSEFGKLKKVLLHRPGRETENLTPSTFEELLFDDSYYLDKAQDEHDAFASVLKKSGVEVIYLEDLVAETIDKNVILKKQFVEQFVKEGNIDSKDPLYEKLVKFFLSIKDSKEMVLKMMEGTRYSEISTDENSKSLKQLSTDEVFVLKPLPNLIFTRDPFSTIGKGISLHTMYSETRRRETIFAEYIFKHHNDYRNVPQYYGRYDSTSIEGGDVMILTDKAIAVGISQRTDATSITKLAENLFKDSDIEIIYAVDIPKGRSWMHLDTVFTQIDRNKFSIFSNYPFDVYVVKKSGKGFEIKKTTKSIGEIMKVVFGEDVQLIQCGNGDPIDSEREQWNDGSNVLAIAPNEVITYNRNYVTNKALRDAGVIVHEVPSSELSRGRGGPRCMSMPLERDEV